MGPTAWLLAALVSPAIAAAQTRVTARCEPSFLLTQQATTCRMYLNSNPSQPVKTVNHAFSAAGAYHLTLEYQGMSAATDVTVFPDLAGTWTELKNGGIPRGITHLPKEMRRVTIQTAPRTDGAPPFGLTFTDDVGHTSAGGYASLNEVVATGWNGLEGHVQRINGRTLIFWANNTAWRKDER